MCEDKDEGGRRIESVTRTDKGEGVDSGGEEDEDEYTLQYLTWQQQAAVVAAESEVAAL